MNYIIFSFFDFMLFYGKVVWYNRFNKLYEICTNVMLQLLITTTLIFPIYRIFSLFIILTFQLVIATLASAEQKCWSFSGAPMHGSNVVLLCQNI